MTSSSMQGHNHRRPGLGTLKDFTRSGLGKPIRQFDMGDMAKSETAMEKTEYHSQPLALPVKTPKPKKTVAVPLANSYTNLPPHLLMASLLEQLCYMYVSDRVLARQLFKKLCEQLSKLNIMAPISHLDEMSGLRSQHRSMLNKIVISTIRSLEPVKALTSGENPNFMDRLPPADEDIISQHTSRYRNEFQEIEHLGKGGFGTVFKAQNFLDGREYAVKKIRFRQKNIHKLMKILREVKSLASLLHSNIVGYNAAWMEYDSPTTASSSNTSKTSRDYDLNMSQDDDLSNGEDEEFARNTRWQHGFYPPVMGGMALGACLFSSVQVEELATSPKNVNGTGQRKDNLLQSKVWHNEHQDWASHSTSFLHSSYKSETHFIYDSKHSTSCTTSSIEFTENVSETNFSGNHSTHKGHKNPIPLKCLRPISLQQEMSGSSVSISAANALDSHGDHAYKQSLGIINDSCSLSGGIGHMDTCESYSHKPSPLRQISTGFDPRRFSQYRRHNSNVELGNQVKTFSVEESTSSFNGVGDEKGAVHRSSCYRRSISHDAVRDVEEVMEARNHDYGFHSSITLYIQMELCGQTLQEWLVERNSECMSKDLDLQLMSRINMCIFRQLLEGVHYIHSCGIIHRDLKPRNIFLSSKDLHVKIGDFGLAKSEGLAQTSDGFVESPTSEDIPYASDNHTSGVGTSAYASPEQLKGTYYDSKSDMYSLGIILYELFSVHHTEMERVKSIESLRKSCQCGEDFQEKWSEQADVVQSLTNPVSSRRPSAQELLNSHLFFTQEEKIKKLTDVVEQQSVEIQRLRQENFEKDRLLNMLQARIPDVFMQIKGQLS